MTNKNNKKSKSNLTLVCSFETPDPEITNRISQMRQHLIVDLVYRTMMDKNSSKFQIS